MISIGLKKVIGESTKKNLIYRYISHGKEAKIWYEGNMFAIREKPN